MHQRPLFVFLTVLAAGHIVHAQITVDPLPALTVCGAPTLNVSFTTADTYTADNLFTVELSDAAGSFAEPASIGMAPGTGSGTIQCGFPGGLVAGAGHAIRVVASDPPATGEAYVLPITSVIPPDAGADGALTLCNTAAPLDLVQGLGGAQGGGTWTGPVGPLVGLFNPAVDPPGIYTYTVAATAPCVDDASTVFVVVMQTPDAGIDAAITVCVTDPPFAMLPELTSAQPGGVWTTPTGTAHPNIFEPGVDAPGTYAYTVPGTAPCPNASAQLQIQVLQSCATTTPPDTGLPTE
jgi:hypothetical protein